jgi:gamma-glutamylcyclotransferase (GGCT)/AIG2-like uncharacterized protein YtfP
MNRRPEDPFRLFVYGTLMRGGCRHALLDKQSFLGEARTLPLYALHDLGAYPGMVAQHEGGQAIWGELYAVARTMLPALDETEGAPTLFRLAPVKLEGGNAWAYLYQGNPHGSPLCRGERWENGPG